MERRTGLLRGYTSRVENGRTVPSLGTLEKYAQALGIPLYQIFVDGPRDIKPILLKSKGDRVQWGASGKARIELRQLRRALAKMDDGQRNLLLTVAQQMARRPRKRATSRI